MGWWCSQELNIILIVNSKLPSLFLSRFQSRLLLRNTQRSLFFHFLFSFISSQYTSLISIYFLIWSIHLVLGLPIGGFPSIFVHSIFFGILSFVKPTIYPNHLSLLFWQTEKGKWEDLEYDGVINTLLTITIISLYPCLEEVRNSSPWKSREHFSVPVSGDSKILGDILI